MTDFGGLCFNGHDVPVGAMFCPICGSQVTAASGPPTGGFPPPPAYPPAQGYPPPAGFPPPTQPWAGGPGGGYPPAAYGYQPGAAGPATGGTNGLAIASLVLGILWVFWIGSFLAVIFGHIGLHQTRQRGQRGQGLAIAGLVLGYVGVLILVIGIIAAAAGVHSNTNGG